VAKKNIFRIYIMPLIPTKTKSIIGTIIDPELEDQLDNDEGDTIRL
jgi:hypothetical protein